MKQWLKNIAPTAITSWGFALALAAFAGWISDKIIPESFQLDVQGIRLCIGLIIFAFSGLLIQIILWYPDTNFKSPRLLLFRSDPPYTNGLFLFAPSDWLIYRSSYALFYVEEGSFERLLCVAHVLIVQDDKKIQLVVAEAAPGNEDVWPQLQAGTTDVLKRIIVKPGVPVDG